MARLEGTLAYLGDQLVELATLGEDKVAFTPFIPPLNITYLVVAGGGGGGAQGGDGVPGGGGAGGLIVSSSLISQGSYSVTVGGAGSIDNNGSNSVFLSKTALGGGRGGKVGNQTQMNGANGGSGGGACKMAQGFNTAGIATQPTSAAGGFGNDGSAGADGAFGNDIGGSGGGAGSAAGGGSAGGGLAVSSFQDLGYIDFSYGGPGVKVGGGFASGGSTTASGSGGFANSAGKNGIVIVKYQANEPLATGGIIESGSGWIYHKFNSNGTFTY